MISDRIRTTLVSIAALVAVGGLTAAAAAETPYGVAEAPARADGSIRISAYNVENLFDDRDDPSLEGRYDDCHSYDKTVRAKPEAQRRAVADAIRRVDADVVALQEIESYDALIEFREQFLDGMGYDHVISIDVGQERGIEQAVISRFPIVEASVWPNMLLKGAHPQNARSEAGKPIRYRRSPLRAVVEVPGAGGAEPYRLTLYVVHHKAGRSNGYWREAEAEGLLTKLAGKRRADPDENVIVLGDFNAQVGDRSVDLYTQAGFTDAFADAEPGPEIVTHASGRRIDLIMLSPAAKREFVPGSAFVLGTVQRPRDTDWRDAWRPEGYASDHMPLAIDLTPRDR